MYLRNLENALLSLSLRLQISLSVKDFHFAASLSHSLNAVRKARVRSVYFGNNCDVSNIFLRRRIDFHRSCDTAVVEEVKVRIVLRLSALLFAADARHSAEHVRLAAHRKRCVVDHVVHCDRQQIVTAVCKFVGDLHFERKKTALVLADQLAV